MQGKIKIAVIPAAGLGTRFLPATKAVAKEMLPIIDIPTIQMIINEARESGITKVIIIISKEKDSIIKHFSEMQEYEKELRDKQKDDLANSLNEMNRDIKIIYAYQNEQKGLGHAIYCVKDLVGEESFGVLLGDDLVDRGANKPALKQLLSAYEKTNSTVIGVQRVNCSEVSKYGIINPVLPKETMLIKSIVEKPSLDKAPSSYAAMGRYVLTHDIFKAIENTKPGSGGEIQLTDAFNVLISEGKKVYATQFKGTRYDVGDKGGFVMATIAYALKRDDLRDRITQYIKNLDL